MYNEKPVADFTKAELNKSDRPRINLYKELSIRYGDYKYGLFMYNGTIYFKCRRNYIVSTIRSDEEISNDRLNQDSEIYPLTIDESELAKDTLSNYAKIISAAKDVIDNE